ncbi:hypothetical protein D3C85_838200 [compost metagenome]
MPAPYFREEQEVLPLKCAYSFDRLHPGEDPVMILFLFASEPPDRSYTCPGRFARPDQF